jgi:1,6-anhydro-N-acetylmuramate kinase
MPTDSAAPACCAVTRSIIDNAKRRSEISVIVQSGGGRRNIFLMERLAANIHEGLRRQFNRQMLKLRKAAKLTHAK